MLNPFLLEIGVEEIPHWMLGGALEYLRTSFSALLEQNRLPATELKLDATPRRLVLRAAGLPERQEDREELVMGPPKAAGEGAAAGFARKLGLDTSALRVEATPKGEYFAAVRKTAGREVREILAEALPALIAKTPWPKAMFWTGKDGVRFIRPIRWIVALLGDRIVEFELAGVKSGALTRGHRRMGADEIAFDHANYEERLEKNGVILSVEKRKKKILDGIRKLLKGKFLTLVPDEALLNDLAYLTEFPTPILGDFDPKFLDLPAEVLTMVMRHHQRYFTVRDAEGRLAPHFIAVMNIKADRKGLVKKGNERVIEARFNDARFFWEFDQHKKLADRVQDLAHVTFQAKLGSYLDKTNRCMELARTLGFGQPQVLRALELAKCDLTTEMVKEFTDLQGVMGGLYAGSQGEAEEVACAIYEQYKPASMEDRIPTTPVGQIVSLVDRWDTLTGCFSVGLIPSGSKDPFALRRAAQGVVKILVEGQHRFLPPMTSPELKEFFLDRVRYYFRDVRGFAYDEVNAVLAGEWPDLADVEARLEALQRVRKTEDFEPLAAAFKRIRNILKQAGWTGGSLDAALLEAPEERDLHEQSSQALAEVAARRKTGAYLEAFSRVAALRPVVDRFFDRVLVNAPDERVRLNRLALLGRLFTEVSAIADFSEIVTGNPQ